MRFQAFEEMLGGEPLIVLHDREADSSVVIVPGIGCNVIRCRLQGNDVIEEPPNLEALASRSSEFGVPLLWPPDRIPGGSFTFNERTYTYPPNDGMNHLHGELRRMPWEIVSLDADEKDGASAEAEFRFDLPRGESDYYPHPVTLRLTYRLCGSRLSGSIAVVNEGEDEAPLGFGLHPYFSFQGDAGQIELSAPVGLQYKYSDNGQILCQPAHTGLCGHLKRGMPLGGLPSDEDHFIFRMSGERRPCSIDYRDKGIRLDLRFDPEEFPYLVVFKPSWADAVSLEPWSCISDAFNSPLAPEWTGAAGLGPGERRKFHWSWEIVSPD